MTTSRKIDISVLSDPSRVKEASFTATNDKLISALDRARFDLLSTSEFGCGSF